jgi:hypothetical protein
MAPSKDHEAASTQPTGSSQTKKDAGLELKESELKDVNGGVAAQTTTVSPRDAASGMASGKRQ